MSTQITNHSGLNVGGINVKSTLEDFLKLEYTEGLRNEFSEMEALINHLAKDTITGKKKYKSFALGITDNFRALGRSNDMYKLEASDYTRGADVVDAEFDTTKLLGVFSITDETILKGSTDGSLFDVLGDSLDRMMTGLKHTMQRFTYGSATGLIGNTVGAATAVADSTTANPGVQAGKGDSKNPVTGTAIGPYATNRFQRLKITNSYSLLPGMGVMFKKATGITSGSGTAQQFASGRIFQKDNSTVGNEFLIVLLDLAPNGEVYNLLPDGCEIYSRQLAPGTAGEVKAEYTGLHDIVILQDNKIFGVDRSFYKALNCTKKNLSGSLLTEQELRDMGDYIELTSPAGGGCNYIISNHKIISTIQSQLYQTQQYITQGTLNGQITLGRANVTFDNQQLYKDKYSREQNVYLLDTTKVGELLRKEFDWITSGREGVLERIDGTEIFEGIMTKYADMYVDSLKSHASFVNAAETVI